MARDLPAFLRDLINSPPHAGEGVHAWLYKVSRQLHAHFPAMEIVRLLENRLRNCGRHVPLSEIVAAVQDSIPCAWKPNAQRGIATAPVSRRWPELNEQLRLEIIANSGELVDLWEASPVRLEDDAAHTEELIDMLFSGNPLLCCGEASDIFDTRPRESWRGELAGLQFIVPSPMSKIEGLTKDGKPSRHCLDNTGPRRFLVVEFDTGHADEHAAILLHLRERAPLTLAVHSGGKSLHGWFFCVGQSEKRLETFFRYAVALGADHATWTRSQFLRMPDGTRDNGRRQTVFYFNPQVIKA